MGWVAPAIALLGAIPSVLSFMGGRNAQTVAQKNVNNNYKQTSANSQDAWTRRRTLARETLRDHGFYETPEQLAWFEQNYPEKSPPLPTPGSVAGDPNANARLAQGVIGAVGSAYHSDDEPAGRSAAPARPGASAQALFPEVNFNSMSTNPAPSSPAPAPPITGPGFASTKTQGSPSSALPGSLASPTSATGAPSAAVAAGASNATPNYDTFGNLVYDEKTGSYVSPPRL